MLHPTCGSDLRRFTKVIAMIDSILSGFSIFCGIVVLNAFFFSVKDSDSSACPIGSTIVYIILMAMEIYLAFRLYRAAHERDVERLRTWKKAVGAVLGLATVFVLLIRHTADNNDLSSRYPLLWFYVIYFLAAIFRTYMFWVVSTFITEFELI